VILESAREALVVALRACHLRATASLWWARLYWIGNDHYEWEELRVNERTGEAALLMFV